MLRILGNRGPLSIPQALCAYLCDDPEGPQLTHAEAAARLDMGARQEVSTHLRRAREKADGSGYLFWYANRAQDPTGRMRAAADP